MDRKLGKISIFRELFWVCKRAFFFLMFMIHEWCHKLTIKREKACFSFCDEKSGTLCVFCLSLSRNPTALKHRGAVNIQCLEVLDTCHRCLLLLLLCQRSPLSWHHITGLLCKALTNTVTFWTLADIHPPAPTFFTCFTAISSMWKSAACRSSPVSAVTLKHPSPKHSLDIELCPLNTNDCMSEIGLFFSLCILDYRFELFHFESHYQIRIQIRAAMIPLINFIPTK